MTPVVTSVLRPRLEGSVAVRDGRRLSFAEFGTPHGSPIIWMHGTPGSRRQIPLEVRAHAEENDLRVIGVDRPGIGTSTPYQYPSILDWAADLELLADVLGLDTMRIIGLSGGGPYALAAGAALPERVHAVGVLGGVAPTRGPDAVRGGLVEIAPLITPLLTLPGVRVGLGAAASRAIRLVSPAAGLFLDAYAVVQPRGDKELLGRPEFRSMFLDDLVNGSRFQMSAVLADVVLFTRDWGFTAADVTVPVHWWHGAEDHIVPAEHGRHMVERLPLAELSVVSGRAHLGGLGIALEVLPALMRLGARRVRPAAGPRQPPAEAAQTRT